MELFAVGGKRFGIGYGFAQACRQTVSAANDIQADAFVETVGGFSHEVFPKNLENGRDFSSRPTPIGGGESKEGKCVDAEVRRAADDATGGFRTSTMAGGARQGAGG